MKFTLRTLFVLCLIAALLFVCTLEQQRARRASTSLSRIGQFSEAVRQQERLIQEKQLALEIVLAEVDVQIRKLADPNFDFSRQFAEMPSGFRRTLANIRNDKLRLAREISRLDAMRDELANEALRVTLEKR